MPSSHDRLVRDVARLLVEFGVVHADLVRSAEDRFTEPFELPCVAQLVLSAYVPTRALFANFAAMNASDLNWRIPDLVLQANGKRLVVDICGWRESNARAARKLENIIAASPAANIVAAILVHEPRPAGRRGFTMDAGRDDALDGALESLKRTFDVVVGGSADDEESTVESLRRVWEAASARAQLGNVAWDCIKQVEATGEAWRGEISDFARSALEARLPLKSP